MSLKELKDSMECEQSKDYCEVSSFETKLNEADLEQIAADFTNQCKKYNKLFRRHCRRRHYHLGLIAKITHETNKAELQQLLENGVRTLLIDTVAQKQTQLRELLDRVYLAIKEVQQQQIKHNELVVGLAFEISGDACRVGRLHNDKSVHLNCNDIITLTTDESYHYCGFREISYVKNLKYYLPSLKLNDTLFVGKHGIKGKIVKLLKQNIALLIMSAGFLHSFDYIQLPAQCNVLSEQNYVEIFSHEVIQAQELNAHFIMVTDIRCRRYIKALRSFIKQQQLNLEIMGELNLTYMLQQQTPVKNLLKQLDYLYLKQLFTAPGYLRQAIIEQVVRLAECLEIPIIGFVPIEQCGDFRVYENHKYLWKLQSLVIERSVSCKKYPFIVTKLLSIRKFKLNKRTVTRYVASYDSVVLFVEQTIQNIECQAILLHSTCPRAAYALSRRYIYCPVYILLPADAEDDLECVRS